MTGDRVLDLFVRAGCGLAFEVPPFTIACLCRLLRTFCLRLTASSGAHRFSCRRRGIETDWALLREARGRPVSSPQEIDVFLPAGVVWTISACTMMGSFNA